MTPRPTDVVQRTLAMFPVSVQSLALSARELVLAVLPHAIEIANIKTRVIGYGYGPGHKDMVATLILSKAGVKIGLAYGVALPDPASLLQGSGKVHRYIKVDTKKDLQRPETKKLMEHALDAWRIRSQPANKGKYSVRQKA